MVEITIRYKNSADQQKIISRALSYPDGVSRILTMKSYQWDWIEHIENHNYPFYELLGAAIVLSDEFPSNQGFHADILYNTNYLLKITMELIHESKMNCANVTA